MCVLHENEYVNAAEMCVCKFVPFPVCYLTVSLMFLLIEQFEMDQ